MSKFNVLQSNQRLMPLLGIHSLENETAKNRIKAHFIYLILFGEICVLLQCIWDMCDSSIEFTDKVTKFQIFFPLCQVLCVYFIMRFKVGNIASLNERLQAFVDTEGLHFLINFSFINHPSIH